MADDNTKKLQELQMLEQNLHNILLQKQAFQLEAEETKKSLEEIKNSKGEVFKVIGQLMLQTSKEEAKNELINKEKIIDLRLKAIGNQEKKLTDKVESVRKEFLDNKEKSK